MTEDEARAWVLARHGHETLERLQAFVGWLGEENRSQNLVAPSTLPTVWSRHVVDSLQLLDLGKARSPWLDVGTGGGFPGLVIAMATNEATLLVEPRKRRAEFLDWCVERLALTQVRVAAAKVEAVQSSAAIISARAVAPVENLLRASAHCATTETQWVLPRGNIEVGEIDRLRSRTGMVFHVEQSLTEPRSSILVINAR